MKANILETIAIFSWVFIVFLWAIYTEIPTGTIEYLIKTLPLIIIGMVVNFMISHKVNNK